MMCMIIIYIYLYYTLDGPTNGSKHVARIIT